jgi:repressor LexA
MLTKQQLKLFKVIDKSLKVDGVVPSFDEMKDRIGLKSKSGVHRLVRSLQERGFVHQLENKARAIEILRYPENYDRGTTRHLAPANDNVKVISIDVRGKIAAGTPIAALNDPAAWDEKMDMPQDMLGRGRFYALKVEGDSMIDDGINSGDRVIIQETATAENGAIVVALVDDEEATLKHIYRNADGTIALKPANPRYETRILSASRVKGQGKLVMLVRNY